MAERGACCHLAARRGGAWVPARRRPRAWPAARCLLGHTPRPWRRAAWLPREVILEEHVTRRLTPWALCGPAAPPRGTQAGPLRPPTEPRHVGCAAALLAPRPCRCLARRQGRSTDRRRRRRVALQCRRPPINSRPPHFLLEGAVPPPSKTPPSAASPFVSCSFVFTLGRPLLATYMAAAPPGGVGHYRATPSSRDGGL